MNAVDNEGLFEKAKRYSSIKYALSLIDIVYTFILLFILAGLGLSQNLVSALSQITTAKYLILTLYILVLFILYYILDFPLNFYRSFILEHKFSLTQQRLKNWLGDQLKAGTLSYVITVILLSVLYYILERFPTTWWLLVSLFWIFFSLILAKLTPIIIIPLFFKYKIVSDNLLRERIINLARRMKVKILDVFEIDFSKKTLKANAAFVGIGKSRRVILADTLKDKYTYDEIEVILAHEFSHYQLKHLLKLVLINSASIILIFYIIFRTNNLFLGFFKLSSLSEIAALPLIFIYISIFTIVTQPLENYFSRRFERKADALALKVTGLKEAFISMMEKLSSQNLADRNPHPLIKFFFFDHPPINERIHIAKSL